MIPIPDRMKHLKVDARGYAIPYGVMTDAAGVVHFAVNDEHIRVKSLTKNLCSICGTPLFRGRWMVGGALSMLHPHGALIDPPMHSECCHYALQVCPYLAAPRWLKEIGPTKAAKAEFPDNVILNDPTMIPGRPAGELFVAAMHTGKIRIINESFHYKPAGDYSKVEFWRHGQQLDDVEGRRLALDALASFDANREAAQ